MRSVINLLPQAKIKNLIKMLFKKQLLKTFKHNKNTL